MKISQRGIDLIRRYEGCKLDAYLCQAGVPTIGYGHTKDVKLGDTINLGEAQDLLRDDLQGFEKGVSRIVAVKLEQCQYDALVSFSFNLGLGSLKSSTLLKKLNKGSYMGAAREFPRWNKVRVGGKLIVSRGLVNRRKSEQDCFLDK